MLILVKFTAGLLLLLIGMNIMKDGLEKAAQERLSKLINFLTKSPLMGTLTGTLITALIQSSTAITVLTIGLVNAGVIPFAQAVGIILGTNVGTTVTAQLMSFNLSVIIIPLILLGFAILVFSKKPTLRAFGQGLIGFGLIFAGIDVISKAMEPLKDSPFFLNLLTTFSNNIFLAVLIGAIFTALVHSSSATTGVVIALGFQDLITLPGAIAIILGSNVGTCITAVMVSIGATTGAKQVAAAHVILNVLGVIVALPFMDGFSKLISETAATLPRQIANAHAIFNILSTLVVLPFTKQFANLVIWLVPDKSKF